MDKLECGSSGRCKFLVIEVGDTSSNLPRVFLSGAVHGNERVGPNAVLTAVKELCSGPSELRRGLTVAVPMTNPYGYYHNVREELGIDPNRDFPYDQSPDKCMQTLTARVVYSIFSNYQTISSGITFHAGETSISFPWGSTNHVNDKAKDYSFLLGVAQSMQRVAGMHSSKPTYASLGEMSKIVYTVNGGMEDWAYAQSQESLVQCIPSTWGGWTPLNGNIPVSASIFLIESNTNKTPSESELGDSDELLSANNIFIAPLPRCVRMALEVVRLASPRTEIVPLLFPSGDRGVINWGCNDATSACGASTCNSLSLIDGCDTLVVEYDPTWGQNRESNTSIGAASIAANCAQINNIQYGVCFAPASVFLNPVLLHAVPALYVDGRKVWNSVIDTMTQITGLTVLPGAIIRLEGKGLNATGVVVGELVTSEVPTSNGIASNTTTPSSLRDESSHNISKNLLFLILIIPAGLIACVSVRAGRRRITYQNLEAHSP